MTLRGQALHVHTFLDSERQAATADALARACADLGMTDLSEDATVRPGGPWPRWLRSSPAPDRIYQALRYDSARLTAVLVCLAPQGDGDGWKELDQQWSDPAGDHVGRVRLFYALYDGDRDPARLATEAGEALPGEPGLSLAAEIAEGVFLWETALFPADRSERVLVLLAPASAETTADALVWPSGNAALPPLPGYLWQTAVIRHEGRRFADRRAASPPGLLHDLAAEFETAEKTGFRDADERDRKLDMLQRKTALAAAAEAALRTLHRTAEVAAANARVWLEPLPGDRDYTAWLLAEADDAIGGLRDAVAYAEPLARIGLAETEKRLRDLGARSEFLTLLQTSVIAAATLALAASQTLNYDWPTYASLQTPFIVTVTLLGLAGPLGAAALNPFARKRLVRSAAVVVTGLGAALGWLAWTGLVRSNSGHPPGRLASCVAAAVLAVVVLGAGWGARERIRSRRNVT
jgi:hypothetical protein